jgi:thiamine transport system permease protein
VRLVDWPLLRRPLAAALAIATALSLGDLGVAAFFGSGNILTLPLLLYQRLGNYRMAESASIALLLAVLALALFAAAQRWSEEPLARSR